ncbi:MAG: hypothetical protein BGO51_21985 [Rhodospirillales bacterium 69-11]|nr:MAG: hypothetical protein BGO51_21985 [Rhodospirillales bacterium 69-11]
MTFFGLPHPLLCLLAGLRLGLALGFEPVGFFLRLFFRFNPFALCFRLGLFAGLFRSLSFDTVLAFLLLPFFLFLPQAGQLGAFRLLLLTCDVEGLQGRHRLFLRSYGAGGKFLPVAVVAAHALHPGPDLIQRRFGGIEGSKGGNISHRGLMTGHAVFLCVLPFRQRAALFLFQRVQRVPYALPFSVDCAGLLFKVGYEIFSHSVEGCL